jgi:predicted DNA binding CopG/RHH family protein
MKIDADEKELLESVERGEWKSAKGGKRERARYSRYARATFRKDRRLNIRLSSKDLEAIQKRALAEGLPYQTLISSLLHKYGSKGIGEHRYGFISAERFVVIAKEDSGRPSGTWSEPAFLSARR